MNQSQLCQQWALWTSETGDTYPLFPSNMLKDTPQVMPAVFSVCERSRPIPLVIAQNRRTYFVLVSIIKVLFH